MEKRYETRSGDLFVRSWARVRRVSLEFTIVIIIITINIEINITIF